MVFLLNFLACVSSCLEIMKDGNCVVLCWRRPTPISKARFHFLWPIHCLEIALHFYSLSTFLSFYFSLSWVISFRFFTHLMTLQDMTKEVFINPLIKSKFSPVRGVRYFPCLIAMRAI